ncbi:pyrroline-5-carboxylate reductase [Nitrosomonas communis]|uniref:Pyrroline-5-carboxylate reductase n=1 Tax=Nitrosomonas communis TaxID=44574 RepID=A0A1H2RWT9_9PROT|nr:pyrroline-5-carboxylate reductase [Nitrosomonas communis]SDW23767.1 pyrroline-5-carboxylate reductase [Nitrosomonas communis]
MNITFVGGGNMAGALIGGLLQQDYPRAQIHVVEINAENREKIKHQFGVTTGTELRADFIDRDVIILAVKPQQLFTVAKQLAPLLAGQLVISIAAGIRTSDLSRWLGSYDYIVRAMPNTPSLIRAGVTGLYALPTVTNQQKENATSILNAVGLVLWVEQEALLDAVTAISGSGPAYVFYFMEAMLQAGVELGLSIEQARQLTLQTFLGAVQLAGQSEEDVGILRSRVTSKGGTTEQALLKMEQEDIKNAIVRAVHVAFKRAQQMGDELGSL